MAAAERNPFPRIGRYPGVHGDEPVVRGTRVPVRAIAVAWRAEPNMAAMLAAYPRRIEADILQALAYFQAHRIEIEARIQAQLALAK